MAESFSKLTYARISPRKVSIVGELIRGKDVKLAASILQYTPKAAAPLLNTLLQSAIANAVNNSGMDSDTLYVSRVLVDPGPVLKRMMPRAKGRGNTIRKRTTHITVYVDDISNRKGGHRVGSES
jgi:large subunit ribosomal protein L22